MSGDVRFFVKRYISENRKVLPILPLEKATRLADWPNASPTIDDFGPDFNVAERLDNLVDVDNDCPEARHAAANLLLHTDRKHGRSDSVTHYWFDAPGLKPEVWKDIDGSVLNEIRTGNQQYTVAPPSVLPRKDDPSQTEALIWYGEGAPGKVDPEGLRDSVRLVAVAALAARHWPAKGSRHVVARDLAGFLAARGVDPVNVELVIRCAAEPAGEHGSEGLCFTLHLMSRM